MTLRISKTVIEHSPYLEEMRELALLLWNRNIQLQATVDRLPKTKNGVPVVPYEDVVWWQDGEEMKQFNCWNGPHWVYHGKEGRRVWHEKECRRVDQCYSTREAAEAGGNDGNYQN